MIALIIPPDGGKSKIAEMNRTFKIPLYIGHNSVCFWNSQENRTPMNRISRGERAGSEASTFDQGRAIQLIRSVAPAGVVVGLDPAEYGPAHRIPLHAGAVEPVDQLFLQRCEKALHARVVEAAMRPSHALPDGTKPRNRCLVFLAGVLAAVV